MDYGTSSFISAWFHIDITSLLSQSMCEIYVLAQKCYELLLVFKREYLVKFGCHSHLQKECRDDEILNERNKSLTFMENYNKIVIGRCLAVLVTLSRIATMWCAFMFYLKCSRIIFLTFFNVDITNEKQSRIKSGFDIVWSFYHRFFKSWHYIK